MPSTTRTRRPITAVEVGLTALVALSCLAVNAAAVSGLPRLSLDALGPFALAYRDKAPSFVLSRFSC